MVNELYKKWYDRFKRGIVTKEGHIDILFQKGLITEEEYNSIINLTGYVERTTEPVKVPSKIETIENKVVTIEQGTTDLNTMNSMLLLQIATLESDKSELQKEVKGLNETNSMLLLQIATLTSLVTPSNTEEGGEQ